MIDLNVTFFVQLVNFLVFLVLLNIIVVKPLLGAIQKREKTIADAKASVQNTDDLVARKKAEYEAALEKHRAEARAKVEAARVDALKVQEEVLGSAKQDAGKILAAGMGEIEAQLAQAKEQLNVESKVIAQLIVQKIVGRAS